MAKSKRSLRSKKRSEKKVQIVYSEPRKVFKEKYLSPKGKGLLENGDISKEEALRKYGKNRYTINPNAKPVKEIRH